MKGLVLSATIATSLVVAAIFVAKIWLEAQPGDNAAPLVVLEARLAGIEDRLVRLQQLEANVRELSALAASTAAMPPAGGARPGKASSRPAGVESFARDTSSAESVFASELGPGEAGETSLQDYIVRVMDDVRLDRAAVQQALALEVRRGPYGEHNLRVNTLASLLDLSEIQIANYYEYLADYGALIEEQRQLEENDPEDRESYRVFREQMRKEFSDVVTAILTPAQAEVFLSLPDFARQPDGPSDTSTTATMPPPLFLPDDEEV